MTVRGAMLVVGLALAGCAAGRADTGDRDAAELAELMAERTAGPAARCIDPSAGTSPQIVGGAMIYRDGRQLWVSHPVGGCPSLRGDVIPIVEVYGSQICRNDRFRTVARGGIGIPGPYCRFGPFVPYEKPRG